MNADPQPNRPWQQALLAPRSIALVGASDDATKNTGRPQQYLAKHGYRGRVALINAARDTVQGQAAYRSVTAVPFAIDHAYIMVPAKAVLAVMRECAVARIPVVTIFSDGFAESGESGQRLQQQLIALARDAGIRVLGPNSMGVIHPRLGLTLSISAVLQLPQLDSGSIGVISQSGNILGTLLSRGQARGIAFSTLVSIGNEADISVGEVVSALVADPATTSILLFVESIRDPAGLSEAACLAFKAAKPIIVYKLGRSEAGQALALSHTGALAGDDKIAEAFFRHYGMLRVDCLETLLELPGLIAGHRPVLRPRRQRVAVLTTTGGGAALIVDRLGQLDITIIAPPQRLVQRLAGYGIQLSQGPLIDLTMAGTKPAIYTSALEALLSGDECDIVIAVVGSSGQFQPEIAIAPIVAAMPAPKPLAVFIAPEAGRSLRLLAKAGVAAFRTPETCADAIRALLNWSPPLKRSDETIAADKRSLAAAMNQAQPRLHEWQSRAVLEALGIPVVAAEVYTEHSEPALGYPLVAKIVSTAIAHKTDIGAVRLSIRNRAELTAAVNAMMASVKSHRPDAAISGVMLQRMEQGLAEVLVGYRRSELGPVVVVGTGGVMSEIYRDYAVRLAPVTTETAIEMIESVAGLALIRGYRQLPRGDIDGLAATICALSQLAALPAVSEAEINPLLVQADGVVALDSLVVCNIDH